MFLADKLERVIRDLAVFEDPHERLAAIIDRAKRLPPLGIEDRISPNRVRGCVSVVWLVGELRGDRCYFRADAESPVIRGLVTFLCDFFNDVKVDEVAVSTLDPLEAADLIRNLSPTRRNGLAAARRAIREFAQKARASTTIHGVGATPHA